MKRITLSYVLTTFNKYSFIAVVLPLLIKNKQVDEEIIVIVVGSKDGTSEYLDGQKESGNIDYFLSEKDKGEAHGFNKGFLLANGDLIKVITDDDAYNYPAIQKCKEYMLLHPEIDVLGGNTGTVSLENMGSLFWAEEFQDDFFRWKEGTLKNFFFNGTCLMIRRSSLALTGLFNTAGLLTDMEYTLRVTSIANLAWCSGIISVRILNPQSNNIVYKQMAAEDSFRLCTYYNYRYPWERHNDNLPPKTLSRKLRSYLSFVKKTLTVQKKKKENCIPQAFSDFQEAHSFCMEWIQNHPLNKEIVFYKKEN